MKPNAGNNGDIDSGKSKIHPVVVFDFRYTLIHTHRYYKRYHYKQNRKVRGLKENEEWTIGTEMNVEFLPKKKKNGELH